MNICKTVFLFLLLVVYSQNYPFSADEEEYEKHIVDKIDNINSITRIGTEDVQEHIQHVMQEISAEEDKDLSRPANDKTHNFLFHENKELETTPPPTIAAASKHDEKKIHSIDLSAKPIYPQVLQQNTSTASHAHPTIAAANINHEKIAKEMSEEKEISTKYEDALEKHISNKLEIPASPAPTILLTTNMSPDDKSLTTKATYEQEKESKTTETAGSKDVFKLNKTTTPEPPKEHVPHNFIVPPTPPSTTTTPTSDTTEETEERDSSAELSIWHKIMLGIRCARQDCRDTLVPTAIPQRRINNSWTISRKAKRVHSKTRLCECAGIR